MAPGSSKSPTRERRFNPWERTYKLGLIIKKVEDFANTFSSTVESIEKWE